MKKYFLQFIMLPFWLMLSVPVLASGDQTPPSIEPPFWWAGMKSPDLQLMVHAKDISLTKAMINYPGVSIESQVSVENPNYLFLNLKLSEDVQPDTFEIRFIIGNKTIFTSNYELKKRREGSTDRKGFDNKDVIYLLMPDRFSNGNPNNDSQEPMIQKANRSEPNGRHGGDIQGITNHLDYLVDLGVTAIWPTPLLENNEPAYSYHGYAITDLYKVDARHGTNEEYTNMISEAHKKGLKVIMDLVLNHYGTGHRWTKDMPMKDWSNVWPEFTRSNYRGGAISDPHGAESDRNKMYRGWFDHHMADFNQKNPFVTNYLIQNSIWWIEYADLDGIRQDTYPYSQKDALAQWMQRLRDEYPNFSVVGEVWLNYAPQVAYWQENSRNKDGYNSNLNYVMDFPLRHALVSALNEENGWDRGIARLYESLSLDFVYENPDQIMNFADNHDTDRLFSALGEDKNKMKMAMTFLLTARGFPQIYYGSEILCVGKENQGHGVMRNDFPGGWANDPVNAFVAEGRTADQNEVFNHIRTLLHFRKDNPVMQTGKLTHYIPEDGVYVYFRHDSDHSVMVILNNNKSAKTIDCKRFQESLAGYTSGTDILYRTYFDHFGTIEIPATSSRVIQLNK
jgi:glycosidase